MNAIANKLRRTQSVQHLVLLALFPGLLLSPNRVGANPQGPNVVAGNVNFQGLNSNRLDINNLSQKAIINWQSFSIASGEVTRVNQGANAFTLNRVVSGNPTEIYGQLKAAQGGVAVINPNGIVVGQGGQIDVAGMLTLSTLDIQNKDFLNGGSNRFKGTTAKGVENYGAISSETGDVVLLGNFLQNAGSVSAPRGVVAFGAGGDIVVDQAGGAKISVQAGGKGHSVGIDNSGEINAAAAELKAHGNVYALAIKNDGLVRASGYNFSGGRLTLSAGSSGRIVNTGTLQARTSEGAGGRVNISGGRVELNAGTVDASGDVGRAGGRVDVSGSEVVLAQGANVNVSGSTGGTARLIGSQSVNLAGGVDATSTVGAGGSIDTTAKNVTIGLTATLNAAGATTGGSIRVGGGFQGNSKDIANATQTTVERGSVIIADGAEGNGGQVVVWADGGTLFEGEISARALGSIGNGGFVEVSGRENLSLDGLVSTSSVNGANGTFLIDPVSVSISAVGGGGTMTDAALRGFVLANNVILHTGGAGASTGNINVLSGAKVIYDSPNSLTFLAHGSIYIDGDIKNIGTTDTTNTGNITLVAGWDGTLPNLPNTSGDPQTRNDYVSSIDFINPDGTPLATPGRFGNWGAAGSGVFFNEAGLEFVEVGSARGETNVFADTIQMRTGRANGRFSQIGYRRVADVRDAVFNPANNQFGAYFANPDDQTVDGNINVAAKSNLFMRPSDEFNADDLGYIRAHTINMIGHGGIRRADNTLDTVAGTNGFGYDAGAVVVDDGDYSGDITVFAGNALVMRAGRNDSPAMIGHGGHAEGTPNGDGTTGSDNGPTDFARSGLGGTIITDLSGDIRVTAGFIDMEGGLYDDSPVQIGHGGFNVRGEFSGDIDVLTTKGNIRASGASNLGDAGPVNPTEGRWTNNRNRSFAMIGHGGFSANHNSALPARTLPVGTGGTTSYAGDGIAINPLTGLPYGHNGDISVVSAGNIHFTATGSDAFAMIGHGGRSSYGDHRGNIDVQALNGDIIFDRIAIQVDRNGLDRRNVGDGAFVQIGHGGRRSSGGNTGDINVSATGSIEFYAGRNEAHAQIGHGGRGIVDVATVGGLANQRNTLYANGTHSGDINVSAGEDIKFRAGFGTGGTSFAMIGNGGYRQYADILENVAFPGVTPFGGGATRIENGALVVDATQQGHNGNITVVAGGDVDFRAGQVEGEILPGQETFGIEQNRTQNFVMIGNGGDESWGDHWGNITINGGGDLVMEARGGWNAITYENTNEGPYNLTTMTNVGWRSAPRLGANEDNGGNGVRNFAYIGNGGYSAGHRNNAQPAHRDGSGKRGEGMGVWGPSDINIDVDGDVIVKAAQLDEIGPKLVTRAILQKDQRIVQGVTVNQIYYVDVYGNPVQLSATVGQHNWYSDVVNRTEPNLGDAGDPNLGPNGETMGRVISDVFEYRLSTDATTANRNRFFYRPGAGFSGSLTNPGGVHAVGALEVGGIDYVHGGEIVYASGPAAVSLGLDPNQPYQVINVRVNEGDFQLRPFDRTTGAIGAIPTGQVGPIVTIPAPAGDGEVLTLTQTWNGWKSPDPVPGATDSFAQIGNGGRSTSLTAAGGINPADGDGHRGDIVINAGGGVVLKATDIDPMVSTGQVQAIDRIAYNGTQLKGPGGVDRFDILVGPGAPNGTGGAFSTMVGTVYGTNGTDTRSQLNPSFRSINYAQIGVGGFGARGDHIGNITINAGKTADGTGLLVMGGEGNTDFAQVGAGGYESDGYDPLGAVNSDNNRLGDTGHKGNIYIEVDGKITVQGGGVNSKVVGRTGTTTDTTAAVPVTGSDSNASGGLVANGENQYSYAQIGNGGALTGGSHTGDITLISHEGGLDVLAGNNTRYGYAHVGNGGFSARGEATSGDINIRVDGDIRVRGGVPFVDDGSYVASNPFLFSGVPLTGPTAGGAIALTGVTNTLGTATIVLTAANPSLYVGQPVSGAGIPGGSYITNIAGTTVTISANTTAAVTAFTAGHNGQIASTHISYAQIGNGGWDADPQAGNLNLSAASANGGFTGSISLVSVNGGLTLQGGGDPSLTRNDDAFFRGLSAQIGNGGNFTDGNHQGNILVSVKKNLSIFGAAGGRDGYTMIGHGGHQIDGNLEGDIQVIAGGNMVVNRGADTDTSAVGSTNRAGQELFNNWVKIGHGDHEFGTQRNDGLGTRNGDIHISVGNTLNIGASANRPYADAAYTRNFADRVLIGHIDSKISLADAFRSTDGNTYIAVGRNNPYKSGTGQLITTDQTIIMSAGEGLFGELRLYMPTSASNQIAEDTLINNAEYTRTPVPGSNRADETPATEHEFTLGANGELEASFTPEGVYNFQGFGLYNIYYGGTAPVVPPVVPPIPPTPPLPPVDPGFNFGAFLFGDTFDAFFRSEELFLYDGYEGLLGSMALSDALYDDSPIETGGSFFEEVLDSSLGDRRYGEITTGSNVLEDEDDEERERRKRRATQQVGRGGVSYYVFDPGTNRYSSFRVFGVEQSRLGVTQ